MNKSFMTGVVEDLKEKLEAEKSKVPLDEEAIQDLEILLAEAERQLEEAPE